MECPHCGGALEHDGIFGRLCAHQDGKKLGDIYACPNGRGQGEIECDSAAFNGFFHTYDKDGELREGYPC